MDVDNVEELNSIAKVMDSSITYNLSCEIMWSAMNHLKDNPECTISEALRWGWDR